MSKALEYLLSRPLLCTPEAAEAAALIVSRDPDAPQAADRPRPPFGQDDARVNMGKACGVAVVPVRGGISRYTTMMQELGCGGTSVDSLTRDIRAAANDPAVRSILLDIDSPGGEANGVGELASFIRSTCEKAKPVDAYIGGAGDSGAYWLASACRQVAMAESAECGSIGVVCGYRVAADRPGVKSYKFISTQSPLKHADPGSDAGRESIQAHCDSLASIFIANVARYRGVDASRVATDFGKGDVMHGHAAVAAGMADGVSDFDTVLGRLARGLPAVDAAPSTPTEPVVTAVPATAATSPPSTSKGQSMNLAALFTLAKKNPEVAAAIGVAESDATAAAVDAANVAAADLAAGKANAIPADVLAKIKADAVADFRAAQVDGLVAKFESEGKAFFASLVKGGKFLPTQLSAFVAHYVDSAKLDATAPLKAADGSTVSRVDSLKALATPAAGTSRTADAVAETPDALARLAATSGLTTLPADATTDDAAAKASDARKAAALAAFGPVNSGK